MTTFLRYLLASLLLALPRAAYATFPGSNGHIAHNGVLGDPGVSLYNAIIVTDVGTLTGPAEDVGYLYPVWSADGSQLAFVRWNFALNRTSINIIRKDGSGEREILGQEVFGPPGRGYIYYPAWLPDGHSISFIRWDFVFGESSIYRVDTDGTHLVRVLGPDVVLPPPNQLTSTHEWSSQGDLVLICDVPGIYVLPVRGICVRSSNGAVRRIHIPSPDPIAPGTVNVGNSAIPTSVSWWPDGQSILITAGYTTRNGDHFVNRSEILRINKDGTDLREITHAEPACLDRDSSTLMTWTHAVPSPDGTALLGYGTKRIADPNAHQCVSLTNFTVGFWIMDAHGGAPGLFLERPQHFAPAWQPIPQSVTFDISDGHGNPLKGMRVELRRPTGEVIDNQPINTAGGKYVFEQGLAPGDYVARAVLTDHCPECDDPAFDVRYAPGPDEPVWLEWRVTVAPSQRPSFALTVDQLDPNLQAYNVPADAAPWLDDMANVFYQTTRFVDWIKTRIVDDPGPTVSIYTFATSDPLDQSTVFPRTARYESPGIIVIGTAESKYEARDGNDDDDAPQNVEWHEYTHHLYETWIHPVECPDAINHRGYNNPSSCDSFSEGFAIFLPTVFAHDLDITDAGYAGIWSLAFPVKAWEYRYVSLDPDAVGHNLEEFAVAALLWDLVIRKGNSEPSHVIGVDRLFHSVTYTNASPAMTLTGLWALLVNREPGHQIGTVSGFHGVLGEPELTIDLDGDGVADAAPIDIPFLMHGFYPIDTDQELTDTHKINDYDVGYRNQHLSQRRNLAIGETGHHIYDEKGEIERAIPRSNIAPTPHANIGLTVLDAASLPLDGAIVNLDISYPGGQTRIRRRLSRGSDALVHLELPPYFSYLLPEGVALPPCDPLHDRNVSVRITVEKDGHLSSDTASFDNCTYLHAVAAATGPAALSFSMRVPVTGVTDVFAPTTTASVSPPPNAAGWNDRNATVTLAAVDVGGSGVNRVSFSSTGAQVTPATLVAGSDATITISSQGETTLSYYAEDNAGNRESSGSLAVRIDTSAPTIAFGQPTPAPNASGWNNTDVSIGFTAVDTLSGVRSVDRSTPLTLSSEGAAISDAVTVVDVAGNGATYTSPVVRIDRTPPVITFRGNAGVYTVNQSVSINCLVLDPAAADGSAGSGIASTTCDNVNMPAYSFRPGENVISASAIDVAGNATSGSVTFTVQASQASLCLLTRQFVEGSSRFSTLPPAVRARADALITALCQHLVEMTRPPTPAQKARAIAAYQAVLSNLVSGGWLTASQAAILLDWSKALP